MSVNEGNKKVAMKNKDVAGEEVLQGMVRHYKSVENKFGDDLLLPCVHLSGCLPVTLELSAFCSHVHLH